MMRTFNGRSSETKKYMRKRKDWEAAFKAKIEQRSEALQHFEVDDILKDPNIQRFTFSDDED